MRTHDRKLSSALIGVGEGPRVPAGGESALKVFGLQPGEHIVVRLHSEDRWEDLTVAEDGFHQLASASFVQVFYRGKSKTFCAVLEN